MFDEPDDYINSCVDVNAPHLKTDYHTEIFKKPKLTNKEKKEKNLINNLPQKYNKSSCLFKLKTIEGERGYIYENKEWFDGKEFKSVEDWFESDVVYKENNILYVSGYKDEPIIITDKSDKILFIINDNDNNKNLKLDNIEKIQINIDLYHSKIVYIDTITVKQKVALMLSLMNYEDLPYELYIFKKICNYIT